VRAGRQLHPDPGQVAVEDPQGAVAQQVRELMEQMRPSNDLWRSMSRRSMAR
jgi:hypothetical protein